MSPTPAVWLGGITPASFYSLCKSIRSEFFLIILNNMHATTNLAWKFYVEFNYLQVNIIRRRKKNIRVSGNMGGSSYMKHEYFFPYTE